MRIAQVAPLYESVPPKLYGGTERVVSSLTEELVAQGHSILWLNIGDPLKFDFPTPPHMIEAVTRAMRDGKLNDPNFGSRMSGHGIFAEQIEKTFEIACRKAGILGRRPALSTAAFQRPSGPQLELF